MEMHNRIEGAGESLSVTYLGTMPGNSRKILHYCYWKLLFHQLITILLIACENHEL